MTEAYSSPRTGRPSRHASPGRTSGTFDCTISAILGLVQIPWKGPISLTLTGEQSGGEIQTLTIAPGARISGTDQYDGSFSANLSGILDCPAQKLTGALDGNYQLAMGIINVNAMFAGNMGANYTGNSTPPAFTNGVIGPLASPQWGAMADSSGPASGRRRSSDDLLAAAHITRESADPMR